MKPDYVGWQIGINYQAPDPSGVTFDYVRDVIDRSADAGMNFISFMMVSHAFHCPEHDGYAWPVQNPRLTPLKDVACLNAAPKTEFVSRALEYAKSRNFHCQLMMNALLWNPQRVAASYPDATQQCFSDGTARPWLFCPDSPGSWQLALDEVTDLLEFYRDSPVDSFQFERIGYDHGTCYCPHTSRRFRADMDADLNASSRDFLKWKGHATLDHLKRYVAHIREVRPGIETWVHTGGEPEWGHFPHVLVASGAETVANGPHELITRKAFWRQLDWLAPSICVPHLCVRDVPTHNYPVPIKTPEMIRDFANWLETYPGDRVAGAIFFNEVCTGETNKAVVYDVVKRWSEGV
jgi:hypothetical protein